ncbi:G Protein, Alpha subunit family member (gpa-3), partial [Reticulomyxa filosa]
ASFVVKDNTFEVYDVGGQRSERQKWIHCFDGVNAVLFVVSLSSYDQMLYEDNSVNAMTEAIELWEDVANSPYFSNKKISMIIFFNKSDLFSIKVAKKSIKALFKEYAGSEFDFQESIVFIRGVFLGKLRDNSKQIYTVLFFF